MQRRNLILTALSIAAFSAVAFIIGRITAPSTGNGGTPPFGEFPRIIDSIIKGLADCMPRNAVGPGCPCPPPPIICHPVYLLNSDLIGPSKVDFVFSYDSTNQSVTATWNMKLKITQAEAKQLAPQPSEPFLGRELAEFYWKALHQTKSSIAPLEIKTSYGASYEKAGDLKTEIQVVVDAMKSSFFCSVKLTPRKNIR